MLTIVFVLSWLFVCVAISTAALRASRWWINSPDLTYARALSATLAVGVMGAAITALAASTDVLPLLLLYLVAAIVSCGVALVKILRISKGRALLAYLVLFASSLVSIPVARYVVIPHLFEAYVIPTNSMAPALLGKHVTGKCVECGSVAYGSPAVETYGGLHDAGPMICARERKKCATAEISSVVFAGDRILSNKQLKPKRWDLVTFRPPDTPETMYVMRLVGLPGEEIVIREGAVWADGKRLEPPEKVGPLHYVDHLEGAPRGLRLWGTEQPPAKLGADEFFVLGDHSTAARDSRIFNTVKASTRPPYAVPLEAIDGVVTHIYWPPSRWRAF